LNGTFLLRGGAARKAEGLRGAFGVDDGGRGRGWQRREAFGIFWTCPAGCVWTRWSARAQISWSRAPRAY